MDKQQKALEKDLEEMIRQIVVTETDTDTGTDPDRATDEVHKNVCTQVN